MRRLTKLLLLLVIAVALSSGSVEAMRMSCCDQTAHAQDMPCNGNNSDSQKCGVSMFCAKCFYSVSIADKIFAETFLSSQNVAMPKPLPAFFDHLALAPERPPKFFA